MGRHPFVLFLRLTNRRAPYICQFGYTRLRDLTLRDVHMHELH
jgi:hypothetical protein